MDIIRYAEDIIVGTVRHGAWSWYLGDKEDWFLQWQPEFESSEREEGDATDAFLRRAARWRTATDELRSLLTDDLYEKESKGRCFLSRVPKSERYRIISGRDVLGLERAAAAGEEPAQ